MLYGDPPLRYLKGQFTQLDEIIKVWVTENLRKIKNKNLSQSVQIWLISNNEILVEFLELYFSLKCHVLL